MSPSTRRSDEDEQGLEIDYGKKRVRARGDLTIYILVLSVGLGILGYLMATDHNRMTAMHVEMLNTAAEHSYILTLTVDERTALRLPMPDSLRDKLRR